METPLVRLEHEALWKSFHDHHTEMIVTKPGRKMFPKLAFRIEGLHPEIVYGLQLIFRRVDEHRYKFQDGEWVIAGRGDPDVETRPVFHHEGPTAQGRTWMRQPVSFDRIKLTNNVVNKDVHVLINSMHKYQPVLLIYRIPATPGEVPPVIAQVVLEETQFIAVTAYQNEAIIKLKIANNPFAKGFRESKRSRSHSPDDEPEVKRKCAEQDELSMVPPTSLASLFAMGFTGNPWSPYPAYTWPPQLPFPYMIPQLRFPFYPMMPLRDTFQ